MLLVHHFEILKSLRHRFSWSDDCVIWEDPEVITPQAHEDLRSEAVNEVAFRPGETNAVLLKLDEPGAEQCPAKHDVNVERSDMRRVHVTTDHLDYIFELRDLLAVMLSQKSDFLQEGFLLTLVHQQLLDLKTDDD